MNSPLERAWLWREQRGVLAELPSVRLFHGPGEGTGPWRDLAIDRYGDHAWVTEWESEKASAPQGASRPLPRKPMHAEIARFLEAKGLRSGVILARPERDVPQEPVALFGTPPQDPFTVEESGNRFRIRLLGSRHPGLFLDHAPLRQWLMKRSRGWNVLNTFAYTGSLSIAAARGGAAHVTTLDLANSAIRWARENWELNQFAEEKARFIAGDVFEWLPRLKREGKQFDCVILDPPSFSRGDKGRFSTAKDLERLHGLALDLVSDGGMMVTSINSANVPWSKYEGDLLNAAASRKLELIVRGRIDQPETFPSPLKDGAARYLKGFILSIHR